jgi:hypothetical protein
MIFRTSRLSRNGASGSFDRIRRSCFDTGSSKFDALALLHAKLSLRLSLLMRTVERV